MRTLNGLTIGDGVPRPLRSLSPVRAIYAALVFGCFVLPGASELPAGDLFVKEYIYLDGNLLAVERQLVPLPAALSAEAAGTVLGGKSAPFPGPDGIFTGRGDSAAVSAGPGGVERDPLRRPVPDAALFRAATPLPRSGADRSPALIGLLAPERVLNTVPGDPKGENHGN